MLTEHETPARTDLGVIWKSELSFDARDGRAEVAMPLGARILRLEVQRGVACIWYECQPLNERETRTFLLVSTGEPVPNGEYVCTFMLNNETQVFHVYELLR